MAATSKTLFRGAAATTSTTLYTTPSGSTAVITNIAVTNTTSTDSNFTLLFDDVSFGTNITVGANDTTLVDLKQTLTAAKTIKGSAGTTAVNFHISGVEIA